MDIDIHEMPLLSYRMIRDQFLEVIVDGEGEASGGVLFDVHLSLAFRSLLFLFVGSSARDGGEGGGVLKGGC